METEEVVKTTDQVNNPEEQSHKEAPKNNRKSTIKYILNIVLVLVVSAVAIFLALRNNFTIVLNYITNADYRFLLIILGLMTLYYAIRAFMFFAFARLFTRDYHYHQGVALEFIGAFYAAVTPGGQGGEVMQAYTYKKQGIPMSSAVSALAMHSILHQIILILFGLVSFIVKYDFIGTLPNANLGTYGDFTLTVPMWVLTILGFGLNLGYMLLILGMSYWKGFHNFIMGPIITFLSKLHIIKNPDKSRENMRSSILNFKMEIRRLFTNIPFTILISVCFVVSMGIKFAIPYFVGLSMGNQSEIATFWDSIFLSNYHQMATGLIPIPGSAGVSEFVFNALYSNSPAVASNSFFFVNADLETQIYWFNKIAADPSNMAYVRFFRNVGKVMVMPEGVAYDANVYLQEIETIHNTGGNYLNASEELKQVIMHYANTRESSSMASAALVMWRFITFIFPLIIAGFVTAFYRSSPKKEAEEREHLANRQTLVDLRSETYSERYAMVETMVETSRLTRESVAKRLKALAKNDRRKKAKAKREKQKLDEMESSQGEFTDINIENEDDSL